MAIKFQDSSYVADFLRNQFQDTVLASVKSFQEFDEKKEKEQNAKELQLTKIRANGLLNEIETLNNRNDIVSNSELEKLNQGIAALRATNPDNEIIQAQADNVQSVLNNFQNQQYDTAASLSEIDNLYKEVKDVISAPYQSGDLDSLVSELKNTVNNVGSTYSSNVIDKRKDEGNELLARLNLVNSLSKQDVSDDEGLQLDNLKTTLKLKNNNLTDIDSFESNSYQEAIKLADYFMGEGEFEQAEKIFNEAQILKGSQNALAKDIKQVVSIYYNDDGSLKQEFAEKNAFMLDGLSTIEAPFVDVLNSALRTAEAGDLEESKKLLDKIPRTIRASEDAKTKYEIVQNQKEQKLEFEKSQETISSKAQNIRNSVKKLNEKDINFANLDIGDKVKVQNAFKNISNLNMESVLPSKIDTKNTIKRANEVKTNFADMFVQFKSGDKFSQLSQELRDELDKYEVLSEDNKVDRKLLAQSIFNIIEKNGEIDRIDLASGLGLGTGAGFDVFRGRLRDIQSMINDYDVLIDNLPPAED